MTPLSRYRVPKIAQHAAFGHMNDYDLETQSLVETDQVVGARDSVPTCDDLHRGIFDGRSLS
jgi:hypothetical protein